MASPGISRTVQFGVFEVDLRAGELRKHGVRIRLQEQPLQILGMLLESPGRVITREELRQRIWPSDTFVDFDQGINNAVKRLREALGDSAETPHYIETLARRGYRFIGSIQTTSPSMHSLAVLPLENLSRDPEQEYFAEGLTEALITTLAKIGELRVVSRTSAMLYKGVRKPLREIARELEVDTIVEGTVLRVGDRVRITAQLIDPIKETHLWAESYDRHLRDVLDLQAEVAQTIAREVRVKLTPQEQAQLAHVRTVDPEAYEAYLKGRYHWNRRSGDGLPKAVNFFQEAIEKDPQFAAAYSGLADSLTSLSIFGFVKPDDGIARGVNPARRAVELDASLAEAHTSVAWVKTWYEFDFPGAEREFERAIELNPRYAAARGWFGYYLGLMGRYEEAYTECKRAIRLDPASAVLHWDMASVLWMARRSDQVIEIVQKTVDLDASFAWAYIFLASVHSGNGNHQAAIAAAQKSVEVSPDSVLALSFLTGAYAAAGERRDAAATISRLHELSNKQYVMPYLMARAYAAIGETEHALDCLERAYAERAPLIAYMKSDPGVDSLRSEPRFQELLRRMNFPT